MTQPEETEGMNILSHLKWVSAALGSVPEYIVVNSAPIPDDLVAGYRLEGADPLCPDRHQREKIRKLGCTMLEVPMIQVIDSKLVRHDSFKLAETLLRLCREVTR
jgi:hypothetical protein